MHRNAMKRLALAGVLLVTASACDRPVSTPLPPAIDVEAATEPKPVPTADIVTDEAASIAYDNAIEAWGERVQAAGVRICEWLNAAAKDADYKCERSPD